MSSPTPGESYICSDHQARALLFRTSTEELFLAAGAFQKTVPFPQRATKWHRWVCIYVWRKEWCLWLFPSLRLQFQVSFSRFCHAQLDPCAAVYSQISFFSMPGGEGGHTLLCNNTSMIYNILKNRVAKHLTVEILEAPNYQCAYPWHRANLKKQRKNSNNSSFFSDYLFNN